MLVKILIRCLDTGALYSKTIQQNKEHFTIGRMHTDVVLSNSKCSRLHAVVSEVPGVGFVLRDLGSINGTFLNDQLISSARLRSGDQIRIGRMKLSVIAAVSKEELKKAQKETAEKHEVTRLAQNGIMHGWPGALECIPRSK